MATISGNGPVSSGRVNLLEIDKEKVIDPFLLLILVLSGCADALHTLQGPQLSEMDNYQKVYDGMKDEMEALQTRMEAFNVTNDNLDDYVDLQTQFMMKSSLAQELSNKIAQFTESTVNQTMQEKESLMTLTSKLLKLFLSQRKLKIINNKN